MDTSDNLDAYGNIVASVDLNTSVYLETSGQKRLLPKNHCCVHFLRDLIIASLYDIKGGSHSKN